MVECIELYETLAIEVFGKPKAFQAGTMFSSSRLEAVIRRIVTERTEGDSYSSELLRCPSEEKTCPM